MAKKNGSEEPLEKQFWKAADKLRKNIDLESFYAGSAVPTLNRNHVHKSEAIIPLQDLIKKFGSLVYPNYQKIKKNQTQIRTLTALRDTFLPKLMSGEVRVEM
jgi:type I restriction enzyme, S subunit